MITKEMTIAETMQRFPETVAVFRKLGMECPACMGAGTETIESGAMMHGLETSKVLKELNLVSAASQR